MIHDPNYAGGTLDRFRAADYLSISTRTLDQLASEGKILRIKVGRKTLFRIRDLEAFLERQAQNSSDN